MSGDDLRPADELEALRQSKARYCRFLDTKDVESWRGVFTTDVVVTLDMTVSTGGADPMTAAAPGRSEGPDNFVPMVMGGLEKVATMHPPIQESHAEITLTSATTATGIWAMEDLLIFGDGGESHGAGHYHENYQKQDGTWRIKSLHLTRTILKVER
jgi:hypothetical protein